MPTGRNDIMTSQADLHPFPHRPIRVSVQFPDTLRALVGFVGEDEDLETFESEVKRMIELCGMVSPQAASAD
jgi:hypothetical protein